MRAREGPRRGSSIRPKIVRDIHGLRGCCVERGILRELDGLWGWHHVRWRVGELARGRSSGPAGTGDTYRDLAPSGRNRLAVGWRMEARWHAGEAGRVGRRRRIELGVHDHLAEDHARI